MSQTNAQFKSVFDVLTLPYQKPNVMMNSLAKVSPFLDKIMGSPSENRPVGSLPTFDGRDVKIPINALYPVTYDYRSQFNIQHADIKQPKAAKNVIYATIDAVDQGFTMGITTADMQLLKNKSAQAWADWIKTYWKDTIYGFGVSMVDSLFNGDGSTATRWDGEVKPDFIGLKTVLSSSSYGGKTYADWYEWQSQGSFTASNWDMTSATTVFGHTVSSEFDTIAHAITVATGQLTTPFYDVVQKAVSKCKTFANGKGRYVIVMPPAMYDILWLASLTAMTSANKIVQNSMSMPTETERVSYSQTYTLDGIPVIKEDSRLPNNEIGSAPTYIMPSNKIWIVDLDAVRLEAESSNNFVVSGWQEIPNQYNAMQKSISTTLLWYATRRFNMGVITMPAALTTLVEAAYGI